MKLDYDKETGKALFYKIAHYRIRIPKEDYYVFKTSGNSVYTDDNDHDMSPACTIEIVNTLSKKKSTKRCLQDFETLKADLEKDYNGPRSQFNWV